MDPNTGVIKRNGIEYQLENLLCDAPVTGTIYGVLLNYKGTFSDQGPEINEAQYKEPPKAPILYIKPANTIIGYGMPVPLPKDVHELEVGAALDVVFGSSATRVSEEQALEYVAGYTIVNDISIPHKSVYRPAINQKARDGFCSFGPWVIGRDALTNPDTVGVRVFVNGELRTNNSLHSIPEPHISSRYIIN